MFWSGNYIVVRELNFLLKEENVTLSQVLEADDILQECKADNKALIQFLTKPEVLAELITLITEEPPKNLELASQYRHANIACEVLTSHLTMLSDRLSLDATQMNRLCDFINKDPPLNPLLASYFSKTVEMLLERSPKQDCYLYHIVCLRVLDFFKSRRDFLPNLLRHMSTSAIADTFKYFIRLDDLFKKTVMEWLEEHQFLECLIQIVCGTYVAEELAGAAGAQADVPEKAERESSEKADANHKDDAGGSDADADKGSTRGIVTKPAWQQRLENDIEKLRADSGVLTQYINNNSSKKVVRKAEAIFQNKSYQYHTPDQINKKPIEFLDTIKQRLAVKAYRLRRYKGAQGSPRPDNSTEQTAGAGGAGAGAAGSGAAGAGAGAEEAEARARIAAVASANAAALLCDLIVNGCAGEGCSTRPRTSWALVSRLQSEAGVRALLAAMFTSPPRARTHALVNGCQVLRALLMHEPILRMTKASLDEEAAGRGGGGGGGYPGPADCEERSSVELAVAPHLPLLHHALLHDPAQETRAQPEAPGAGEEARPGAVGLARVQVAALLAHLALSEVEEVPTTMLTLGTPGVLVDMFFRYPNNNFLHAQVYTLVKHALTNRVYRTQYARHLFVECDLLTRLMDVYEENKNNKTGVRAAYMGHVVLLLSCTARALGPPELLAHALSLPAPLTDRWQTFLDDTLRPLLQQHDTPLGGYYPSENIYEVEIMADTLAANYDFNDMAATATMDELADDVNAEDGNEMCGAMGSAGETPDFIADGLGIDDADEMRAAKSNFLELASQRFDDDMWEDSGDADVDDDAHDDDEPADVVRDVLEQHSPWENTGGGSSGSGGSGEGWAQFNNDDPFLPAPPAPPAAPAPLTPHAPHAPLAPSAPSFAADTEFSPFWSYSDTQHAHDPDLEASMRTLRLEGELADRRMDDASSVELANNLLTAMSAMSADAIANIVNANLPGAADVTDVDVSAVRDAQQSDATRDGAPRDAGDSDATPR